MPGFFHFPNYPHSFIYLLLKDVMNKNEDFIKRLKEKHGNKYDYSKTIYNGIDNKLIIICFEHGEFYQTAYSHLTGSNCPLCRNKNLSKKYSDTKDEFILKAKKIHNDKYNYDEVNYINGKIKVKIKCSKHGIFNQQPQSHLQGKGCPICKESKGENIIRIFLNDNNIKYIPQKRFKDCKRIRPLPFDFYLPDFNMCIEYDGKQHYTIKNGWFGNKTPNNEYEKIKESENIKKTYCENNGITLHRISYLNKEIIEKLKLMVMK